MKPIDRVGQVWKNAYTSAICLIVRSEHKIVGGIREENHHQIVVLDGFAPKKFWFEDDGTSVWETNGSMTRLL